MTASPDRPQEVDLKPTIGVTNDLAVLCRDCFYIAVSCHPLPSRCPSCGSVRILCHAELTSLSIAHLDCDAFFASVAKRDDPSLVDKPLIIGGGKRGVVSTCCYIARTYGIHSAMPMFKALKLCPHAVVRKPDGPAIALASKQVRAAMEALTPLVQPLSSDEAFMDLTGTQQLHRAAPVVTLARLAATIERDVGISVSIGLSHNKFLAKIASDLDKPKGFAIIGEAETNSFLATKPINFIWGVGASFSARLERDGLKTIGDLQQIDPRILIERYGEIGLRLSRLCYGRDDRPVNPVRATKSISSETTFHKDITAYNRLEDILWQLCEKISARMKDKNFNGRVVTLKLKTADFKSLTRRQTLDHHSNLARVIFAAGKELLRAEIPNPHSAIAYRLLGIGMSELSKADTIPGFLFHDDHDRLSAREQAIDTLRAKFGDDAIGTARGMKRQD